MVTLNVTLYRFYETPGNESSQGFFVLWYKELDDKWSFCYTRDIKEASKKASLNKKML
jgi:hypothetical protein